MAGRGSVDLSERRRWRRRLVAFRPYGIGLVAAGLVGFLGWLVFFSSWLAVDGVEVDGVELLSAKEVVAAAEVDVGTPLARVDLDEITGRIEAIPEVSEADVHRSWPDTVTITVVERTPIAAVRQQGSWWVMDGEGVVFRRTGSRDEALPVVQAPSGLGDEAMREVAEVVTALPADILEDTKRVQAETMDSITVKLRGGREVVWGSAAESERKAEVLRVLLAQEAQVYDVSVPEQPTTSSS
jgi:cell division protein FtsQ